MMRGTSKSITQNTPNYQICDPILEPCAELFRPLARFFLRPVFRNLRGVPPWTDLASPGAPLVRLCRLFDILEAKLFQIAKIPEQQMAPTTPPKNKEGFKTNTDTQSKQICFTCVV